MDPTIQAVSQTMATTPEVVAERPQTPTSPATPLAPKTLDLDPSPLASPEPKYTEPLYTEINIPLPPIPKQKAISTSLPARPRAHTLQGFRPFHRRGSSNDSTNSSKSEEWPRIRKEVKNKDIAARMNMKSRDRRSGTIEAAIVPAVLVLSAELFTPGDSEKKKNAGKWEDAII